jgi:transcriptional regulator with GAF, ATPase, and Fis domain
MRTIVSLRSLETHALQTLSTKLIVLLLLVMTFVYGLSTYISIQVQTSHLMENVLRNAIERAMVVGKPPCIRIEDLPFQLNNRPKVPEADSIAEVERQHIINILDRTGCNITRAAEILKIDRVTLYNKIEKYGLRK